MRIGNISGNVICEAKKYTETSRQETLDVSEGLATNSGVVYERGTVLSAKSYIYTKEQIQSTTYSVENRQFQNNLKILGFYSSSAATDNVAYGIIQWKYSGRKQGLLDMASTMESSVGDCNVQFAYL